MGLGKIKQVYRNASIRKKLLYLFIVQIIVPLVLIVILFFNMASIIIRTKSINYSQDILQMIELRFNDLSANMEGLTMELLYNSRVYAALNNSEEDRLALHEQNSEIRNVLRQAVLSKNEIESICLITSGGKQFSFDSGDVMIPIEDKVDYKRVFEASRRGNGGLVWYLSKDSDGNVDDIYVTRTIYDHDNYQEIGVMALIIKKSYLESIYKDLSKESTNNISIVSSNNDEILRNDTGTKTLLKNFYEKRINDKKGYYIDDENRMLVSYTILDNPDWKIVYHLPLKELYKEIDTLKVWLIIISICVATILSVLSIKTSDDLVKPINNLVAAMRKFEKGGKPDELVINRSDEIGYLALRFNKMSEKIDYLVNQIYKEELSLKEAEIKSLQAQIDPHFLFNTLENINWMAQLNGVPEISDTVSALGRLMDAKIGRGDKMVPLKEELSYVDNYLAILKARYEGRLELYKNINESLLDMKIPKLLIQPLIENSIKHGVGKTTRKGRIEINAFCVGDGIRIEVIDNGLGMTEEQLQNLKKRLEHGNIEEDKKPYGAPERSIGLENVNKRLRLIYGKDCGLLIESKYDEYTKITMNIPHYNVSVKEENHV